MKVQIVVDIDVAKLSSDELDGIREVIGIALTEDLVYPSARICSIEVEE